jgi:hypothetical protein
MEATKQAENTAKGWTNEQLRIFDRWFEALQSVGTPKAAEGWEELRKSTLQSWEESVRNSLNAQSELSDIVVDALGAWAPRPGDGRADEAVTQMQEAVKSWTEAQRQAWSSFFDVAKKVDTSVLTDTWNKMMEASQQSMKKAWETQAQWLASFNSPPESAEKSTN